MNKSYILGFVLGIVWGIVYPILSRNAKLLGNRILLTFKSKKKSREYYQCPCGCGGEVPPTIKPLPESNRPNQSTLDFMRDIQSSIGKGMVTPGLWEVFLRRRPTTPDICKMMDDIEPHIRNKSIFW